MLYLLRTPEIILTGVELVLFHPVVGAQTVRHCRKQISQNVEMSAL